LTCADQRVDGVEHHGSATGFAKRAGLKNLDAHAHHPY